MRGWLVNDLLTCIPGTRTLWHCLLEWLPGLEDKTGTSFPGLAARVEDDAFLHGAPDYVVRNATYFRALDLDCPTISLLQDVQHGHARAQQVGVCRRSSRVVVNSLRTLALYPELDPARVSIVPLGVDFGHFRPGLERVPGIDPESVLFVGAVNVYPKGFDRLRALIEAVDRPFCLVLKDDVPFYHPRATVFRRADATLMARIYNSCRVLVCTSREETQHLAGIEAGACGIPVVATPVGTYPELGEGPWGCVAEPEELAWAVSQVANSHERYAPRDFFRARFSFEVCEARWRAVVREVLS